MAETKHSRRMEVDLADAEALATALMARLQPFAHRLAVAGSIRRREPLVSDIELVIVPCLESRPVDLFERRDVDLACEELDRWLAAGEIHRRPSETGVFTWGPLNRLSLHPSGIAVDFFIEPHLEDWWRSLVFRTGPKDFNIRLIQLAAQRGLHVHAYGMGITDARGWPVACGSEAEFLSICGMPWVAPKDRQ